MLLKVTIKCYLDPVENCNHLKCIRCGRCKNACPVDAISYGVRK
ncbi:4Fe-4S binding protein [Eubacterium ventriosum]